MKRCFSVVAVALMVSLSSFAQSKQKIFHLAIGDPERRTRDARVVLDGITDSDNGEVFSGLFVFPLPAKQKKKFPLGAGEARSGPRGPPGGGGGGPGPGKRGNVFQ